MSSISFSVYFRQSYLKQDKGDVFGDTVQLTQCGRIRCHARETETYCLCGEES